jgi:hypothetical protein
MNMLDLAKELGFDIMEPMTKLGKCSSQFIGLMVSNFKNENNEWSGILSSERLKKMKEKVEIIAENETTCLYRFANKLFINKNFANGTRGKRLI